MENSDSIKLTPDYLIKKDQDHETHTETSITPCSCLPHWVVPKAKVTILIDQASTLSQEIIQSRQGSLYIPNIGRSRQGAGIIRLLDMQLLDMLKPGAQLWGHSIRITKSSTDDIDNANLDQEDPTHHEI